VVTKQEKENLLLLLLLVEVIPLTVNREFDRIDELDGRVERR